MSKNSWLLAFDEKVIALSSGDQSPQLCMTFGSSVSLTRESPSCSSMWIWNRSLPPLSTPKAILSLLEAKLKNPTLSSSSVSCCGARSPERPVIQICGTPVRSER